ncbi:preprotein translocase subunit SecE [Buchnera aphidicola]|uniref:preprotein translocase subunit SecE n=1 Tax=Buchnera aphidicola TaxID=9 RepID=UPI003463AF51
MHSNGNLKKNTKKIKILQWSCIFIILFISIIYNILFSDVIFIFHILCNLCLICSAFFVFLYTETGKKMLFLITESKNEIKKIIWPNKKETLYTTFIVSIVTVVMSLVIWGIDNILFHLVSFITNLRL